MGLEGGLSKCKKVSRIKDNSDILGWLDFKYEIFILISKVIFYLCLFQILKSRWNSMGLLQLENSKSVTCFVTSI